jgi:hypothetical protein
MKSRRMRWAGHVVRMRQNRKNAAFLDITPCALVRSNVSEEHRVAIISVTRIGELGTLADILSITSQRAWIASYCQSRP